MDLYVSIMRWYFTYNVVTAPHQTDYHSQFKSITQQHPLPDKCHATTSLPLEAKAQT